MAESPRVTLRTFTVLTMGELNSPVTYPAKLITACQEMHTGINIEGKVGDTLTDHLVQSGMTILDANSITYEQNIDRTYDNGREWVDGMSGAVFECKLEGIVYFLGISQN